MAVKAANGAEKHSEGNDNSGSPVSESAPGPGLTFGYLSVRRSPASLCLFPICGGENLHGAAVMLKIKFSAENTRIPLMWW